jgi:hypothetical protein
MSGARLCDWMSEIRAVEPWVPRPRSSRDGLPIFAASVAASEVPLEEFDESEPPEELDEPDELVPPEEVDALPEESAPPPQAVRPSDTRRRRANPVPGKGLEFIRLYSRLDGVSMAADGKSNLRKYHAANRHFQSASITPCF